jgi:hypothetical protein
MLLLLIKVYENIFLCHTFFQYLASPLYLLNSQLRAQVMCVRTYRQNPFLLHIAKFLQALAGPPLRSQA